MTTHRIVPDPDGWINTVMTTEIAVTPGDGETVVSAAVAEALSEHPRIAHYAAGEIRVPRDDRTVWRVLRAGGMSGPEAASYRQSARRLHTLFDDLTPGTTLPAIRSGAKGPTYDYPDVPGLRLRAFTAADLDRAAPLAIEAGIYPAACPDPASPCCTPPEAHAWCALAARVDRDDTWQMTLEFDGQPLQFELVTLTPVPVVTLTMHLTRERPLWFWREAEAPVFRALRGEGYRILRTRTRKDRPDWIEALKANYSAVEVAEFERVKVLEFPLDAAPFTGWPARRTVGTGIPNLREGTEADFPAVLALLEALPPADKRNMTTYLREWYHLDRAALLLFYDDLGVLRAARMARPRRGTVAGYLLLSAAQTEGYEAKFTAAAKAWARGAGYTELTGFVAARKMGNRRMQAALAASGAVVTAEHTKFREPFSEVSIAL